MDLATVKNWHFWYQKWGSGVMVRLFNVAGVSLVGRGDDGWSSAFDTHVLKRVSKCHQGSSFQFSSLGDDAGWSFVVEWKLNVFPVVTEGLFCIPSSVCSQLHCGRLRNWLLILVLPIVVLSVHSDRSDVIYRSVVVPVFQIQQVVVGVRRVGADVGSDS